MRLVPYIYSWAVLAIVVLALAIRRWTVARHVDETLHLGAGEASIVAQQVVTDRKLRIIDRWGEWLTVIAVLYGLVLAGIYVYGVWVAGSKPVL
jgi:hypothetical protein